MCRLHDGGTALRAVAMVTTHSIRSRHFLFSGNRKQICGVDVTKYGTRSNVSIVNLCTYFDIDSRGAVGTLREL